MRIKYGAKTGLIILSAVSFLFTCFTCNCSKVAASVTSEADYIIYKDSGTYWAVSGKQGGTDYSGTDAKTVIQSAINALPSGGKIFIKKDVDPYPISSQINMAANLTVVSDGAVLQASGANILFDYNGGSNYSGDITIKSLVFDGANEAANYGIVMEDASNIKIEHCIFRSFLSYGLWVGETLRAYVADNTFAFNDSGCKLWRADGAVVKNKCEQNKVIGINCEEIGATIGPADNQKETYLVISENNCYKNGDISDNMKPGHGIRLCNSANVIVDSNVCYENGQYGILLWKCNGGSNGQGGYKGANIVISNNITRKNYRNGIILDGYSVDGTPSIGILVKGNSTEYNILRGISIFYTQQATITNNRVQNNGEGIVEAANTNCDYNIIFGNCVRNNTSLSIQSVGANTVVENNYVYP